MSLSKPLTGGKVWPEEMKELFSAVREAASRFHDAAELMRDDGPLCAPGFFKASGDRLLAALARAGLEP